MMRAAVKIALCWAVLVLAGGLWPGDGGFGLVTPVQAALNDPCYDSGSYTPGFEANDGSCDVTQAGSFQLGDTCGGSYFFSGSMCVPNGAICADNNAPGTFQSGSCVATTPPTAPDAQQPTVPGGFANVDGAGVAPAGGLEPMCGNASPFIGVAIFGFTTGTTLCYESGGRKMGIYSYTDPDGSGGAAWNPFDPATWDSLVMRDLYASDDITAEGTLSVFGGAQIYSPNGQNGMQVTDNGVLVRSGNGNDVASVTTTPGNVAISATDGTTTSSVNVDGADGVDIVGNVATNGPGVAIAGAIGPTSTARIGTGITGDGQGAALAPTSGPAAWADVQIGSKSFTQTNGQGTGLIVNDYGFTASTAGNTSIVMIQGALDYSTGGNSALSGASQQVAGGSSTVMQGADARHIVTDANGRMTVINGVASEASSSMYVVNGYGNTNGVTVNERTAVISGGTDSPTSLTFSDRGAHFANSSTGAPVKVSGVANGTGPFDAANIRQLHAGLASVAALTGLPAPQAGKNNSFGVALGQNGSGTALAMGGQSLLGDAMTVKYGASVAYSSGHIDSTATLGVGFSW